MSQTSFAVFTCDILPTAAPSARAAIQGVVRAELSKPRRRVRQPLGNQWLVRFDDGGFNAFVLVMSTLRARHPDAFRYLVVGWNDMGSVALYPLGGAAPTTLSLVTAMAAVASGADELAAPLLLASGPLTAESFPLQWTEEAGAAEDLLGAPPPRAKRAAATGPRRTVTRARTAPVAPAASVAVPVTASVAVVREVAPVAKAPVAPTVSAAPASVDEETKGRARKNARRKVGSGKARGKQAAKRAGAKAGGKSAAKAPRAERAAEAAKRRRPTATSKRSGGALSRKRRGATVSAKRSTSVKATRGAAAKAKAPKAPRGAAKRKGKNRTR
ncbi:hypothetical protein HUA74_32350 [Myxococcus sp. CA051A]|uniref:hypothetical protein n=1 Tax=Myxococcus sp. CA051A TaxID=2741739 RepID=UPI00157BA83C|nr:hypothetical protein [Myxococcus sp. CA051A]NTX65360.1 hypothetical protein [Myxococcus sp. CA051A]